MGKLSLKKKLYKAQHTQLKKLEGLGSNRSKTIKMSGKPPPFSPTRLCGHYNPKLPFFNVALKLFPRFAIRLIKSLVLIKVLGRVPPTNRSTKFQLSVLSLFLSLSLSPFSLSLSLSLSLSPSVLFLVV